MAHDDGYYYMMIIHQEMDSSDHSNVPWETVLSAGKATLQGKRDKSYDLPFLLARIYGHAQ